MSHYVRLSEAHPSLASFRYKERSLNLVWLEMGEEIEESQEMGEEIGFEVRVYEDNDSLHRQMADHNSIHGGETSFTYAVQRAEVGQIFDIFVYRNGSLSRNITFQVGKVDLRANKVKRDAMKIFGLRSV